MPITVQHLPSAQSVGDVALTAGQGQFLQQQQQFSEQQRQFNQQLFERQRQFNVQTQLQEIGRRQQLRLAEMELAARAAQQRQQFISQRLQARDALQRQLLGIGAQQQQQLFQFGAQQELQQQQAFVQGQRDRARDLARMEQLQFQVQARNAMGQVEAIQRAVERGRLGQDEAQQAMAQLQERFPAVLGDQGPQFVPPEPEGPRTIQLPSPTGDMVEVEMTPEIAQGLLDRDRAMQITQEQNRGRITQQQMQLQEAQRRAQQELQAAQAKSRADMVQQLNQAQTDLLNERNRFIREAFQEGLRSIGNREAARQSAEAAASVFDDSTQGVRRQIQSAIENARQMGGTRVPQDQQPGQQGGVGFRGGPTIPQLPPFMPPGEQTFDQVRQAMRQWHPIFQRPAFNLSSAERAALNEFESSLHRKLVQDGLPFVNSRQGVLQLPAGSFFVDAFGAVQQAPGTGMMSVLQTSPHADPRARELQRRLQGFREAQMGLYDQGQSGFVEEPEPPSGLDSLSASNALAGNPFGGGP